MLVNVLMHQTFCCAIVAVISFNLFLYAQGGRAVSLWFTSPDRNSAHFLYLIKVVNASA